MQLINISLGFCEIDVAVLCSLFGICIKNKLQRIVAHGGYNIVSRIYFVVKRGHLAVAVFIIFGADKSIHIVDGSLCGNDLVSKCKSRYKCFNLTLGNIEMSKGCIIEVVVHHLLEVNRLFVQIFQCGKRHIKQIFLRVSQNFFIEELENGLQIFLCGRVLSNSSYRLCGHVVPLIGVIGTLVISFRITP